MPAMLKKLETVQRGSRIEISTSIQVAQFLLHLPSELRADAFVRISTHRPLWATSVAEAYRASIDENIDCIEFSMRRGGSLAVDMDGVVHH